MLFLSSSAKSPLHVGEPICGKVFASREYQWCKPCYLLVFYLSRPHTLRSQVTLPRDAGTCTRCPFEVRLQHSDGPWYCKISLRFEVGEDGRPLDKISEIAFGEILHSPEGVEAALRRAQLAILNGSVAPADWAKASDADVKKAKEGSLVLGSKKQLSFSTNLVCMDVSGPDVTDLAFLDLPVRFRYLFVVQISSSHL